MKLLKTAMLVSLAFGTVGTALASTGGNGITGGRHDYATRSNYLGTTERPGLKNTAGQCSYCHTPHSAITTALLWNKKMSANTFTWEAGSMTAGGTSFATLSVGNKGPSVKCLACHDGSVAIGDVAMYRGDLNVTANAFKVGGTTPGYTTADGTYGGQAATSKFIIGAGGNLAGTHPIGMPYPYLQAVNTYNGVPTGGSVALLEFASNPHQISTTTVGGGNAPASASYPAKNGLGNQDSYVKLYSDTGGVITAGPTAGNTGIECSSCHDPHNKQTVDDWMLRGTANGSSTSAGYLCTQCHLK